METIEKLTIKDIRVLFSGWAIVGAMKKIHVTFAIVLVTFIVLSSCDQGTSSGIDNTSEQEPSPNADSSLLSLVLSAGTLTPAFTAETTSYTASVTNGTTSITVTPTARSTSATITVHVNDGTAATVASGSASAGLALNAGSNVIGVRVTAEDGSMSTYTVTVTRSGTNPLPVVRIFDHEYADVDGITDAMTEAARANLHIAYWHTSHGSQIPSGLEHMDDFYGDTGRYDFGGLDGPFFDDRYETDLGNSTWDTITRDFLDDNTEINVVMWSWCGQVSGSTEASIADYLSRMATLESDYPGVTFVYMTGHSDGSGSSGNLHLRNQQIRDYCAANNKWLFDFYDIECYDPSGTYYGNRYVTDGCNYDYNNSGSTTETADPAEPTDGDHNWASDWQDAHPGEWWSSGAAHSKPLNANQKAKAAWQLWCAIARQM